MAATGLAGGGECDAFVFDAFPDAGAPDLAVGDDVAVAAEGDPPAAGAPDGLLGAGDDPPDAGTPDWSAGVESGAVAAGDPASAAAPGVEAGCGVIGGGADEGGGGTAGPAGVDCGEGAPVEGADGEPIFAAAVGGLAPPPGFGVFGFEEPPPGGEGGLFGGELILSLRLLPSS